MGSISRLEARITVPTGGWGGTIDDSGGGSAVAWSVAAGSYYMSELLAALYAALNVAAPTDTIYVSISNGVGGSGRVTISGSGVFAIVWVDPEIRDLLGYTGNLSAASSYLAPGHARALWLPDTPYNAPNEIYPWGGWPETDLRSVESASGLCWIYAGQKKETTWLEWAAVRRSRASKANESIAGESAQRFIEDGIWGFAPWGQPGGPIRVYPDADGTAYAEYFAVGLKDFVPDQFVDGWAGGPWKVRLPRLVLQSTGELVPTDGPSSVFIPQNVGHFMALGLPVPNWLFLCQEPSGNLMPSIGDTAVQLGPSGGALHAQPVSGWARTFVGTNEGPGGAFGTIHAALDLALGESYAVIALLSMSSVATGRVLLAQYAYNSVRLDAANYVGFFAGEPTAFVLGAVLGNHDSANVRPVVWSRDCAAQETECLTDLSRGSVTHSNAAQAAQVRGIGAAYGGDNVARVRCGWYSVYKGRNAEGRDWKAYLQRLRWPLSY